MLLIYMYIGTALTIAYYMYRLTEQVKNSHAFLYTICTVHVRVTLFVTANYVCHDFIFMAIKDLNKLVPVAIHQESYWSWWLVVVFVECHAIYGSCINAKYNV